MSDGPKIKAIAPWFGGNRLLAAAVGEELAGSRWVGIPFAGGMPELLYVDAATIIVSDVHRHIINLANVLKDPYMGVRLIRRLKREAYHPDTLHESQAWCKQHDYRPAEDCRDVEAARHYFVCVWMGRSGVAGGGDEFCGSTAQRWNANGGDSNTRYRSAISSMAAWRRILQRCNFVVEDCFDFLANTKDERTNAIYCDPPFPDTGERYKHKFTAAQHRQLPGVLAAFTSARVVCRFYNHPLIRELYPEGVWTWRRLQGRKQTNAPAREVLLINGPSYAEPSHPTLF